MNRSVYVSESAGSDSNTGSVNAPWKTLARVGTAESAGEITGGDRVYLRRGDTWYEKIPTFGSIGNRRLRIGGYGGGARPRICGYKISKAGSWVSEPDGVWSLDLTVAGGAVTGLLTSDDANVGHILLPDGSIKGVKRWTLGALVDEWDFYSDATKVYVKRETDPGGGIQFAVNLNACQPVSNLVITGLHIVGWGGHGFAQYGRGDQTLVQGNLVENIGGSSIGGTTRYGNGVQVWIGARNSTYCRNTIRHCYDAAMTMQGEVDPPNGNLGWRNVNFEENILENNTQSFEVWSQLGPAGETGPGFENCGFRRNICRDAGESWGYEVRPDQAGKGTHLLIYLMELPTEIEVSDNTFYLARDTYSFIAGNGPFPEGYNLHDNNVHLSEGQELTHLTGYTIDEWNSWLAFQGGDTEAGTQFFIHPLTLDKIQDSVTKVAASSAYALTKGEPQRDVWDDPLADLPSPGEPHAIAPAADIAGRFARVAQFKVDSQYGSFSALLAFNTGGGAVVAGNVYGLVQIMVSGPGSGGGASEGIAVMSNALWWPAGSEIWRSTDWVLTRTQDDTVGHHYVWQLHLEMRDLYATMQVVPLIAPPGNGMVLFASPAHVTQLPAGSQKRATAPPWSPTSGSGAPTQTPVFVGQTYVDVSGAGRMYVAKGVASTADWVALN